MTKQMNYKVWDGKKGHIFGTLSEASAYADAYRKQTGVIVAVTETASKVTHTFGK